jgi:hypothetical protein
LSVNNKVVAKDLRFVPANIAATIAKTGAADAQEPAAAPNIIMPALAPDRLARVAAIVTAAGYRLQVLPGITTADIDTGLSYCNHDLCLPMIAVAGQVLRLLQHGGTAATGLNAESEGTLAAPSLPPASASVLIPQVCCGCRGLELERMIAQQCRGRGRFEVTIHGLPSLEGGFVMPAWLATQIYDALNADEGGGLGDGSFVLFSSGLYNKNSPPKTGQRNRPQVRPKVGVVANAAMLYTPQLNNSVLEQISAEGCDPYVPRLTKLLTTNAPLAALADAFVARGINDIICLQSFGCLTGHIQGRGAVAAIKRRHPQLNISFIDYDPGASKVNQDSRLKLALTVARESAAVFVFPGSSSPSKNAVAR